MRRIFALFWLLSFCLLIFFFISDTGVCFVLLLKILAFEYEGEKSVLWSRSYGSITALVSKRREGRSTLRLTMIITSYEFLMSRAAALISTNNTMSQF